MLVGVDIGGTKILAGVATAQGKLLAREHRATSAEEGPGVVMGRIVATIKAVIQGVEGVEGIGESSLAAGSIPGAWAPLAR